MLELLPLFDDHARFGQETIINIGRKRNEFYIRVHISMRLMILGIRFFRRRQDFHQRFAGILGPLNIVKLIVDVNHLVGQAFWLRLVLYNQISIEIIREKTLIFTVGIQPLELLFYFLLLNLCL